MFDHATKPFETMLFLVERDDAIVVQQQTAQERPLLSRRINSKRAACGVFKWKSPSP
jgi:hypothetical protein